jgi:hypothetical protein
MLIAMNMVPPRLIIAVTIPLGINASRPLIHEEKKGCM